MFPDIRLMIAAVVASVVALSCGFGVFAALRVNHEPLSRLPSVTAPLQLVPDNVAGPMVLSSHPSLAVEPEVATAAADESVRESTGNDRSETPPSASAVAESETAASGAEEKTPAVQPAAPPVASPTSLATDDHASGVPEPAPVPPTADRGDTPTGLGETEVAAAGDEAKLDKPAETTGEPAPAATPNVTALELSPASESAPAEQTWPVEQRALAEQNAAVDESAQADQSTLAGQTAATAQTAPAARTASPNEVARLNLEDDATDTSDAAPAPTKKVVRKKGAKTRVAAKTHRKHRTRVAARFNAPDSMFGQPRFVSAPQAFRPSPRRMHSASAKKAPRASSAVGGPFVTTPGH